MWCFTVNVLTTSFSQKLTVIRGNIIRQSAGINACFTIIETKVWPFWLGRWKIIYQRITIAMEIFVTASWVSYEFRGLILLDGKLTGPWVHYSSQNHSDSHHYYCRNRTYWLFTNLNWRLSIDTEINGVYTFFFHYMYRPVFPRQPLTPRRLMLPRHMARKSRVTKLSLQE